jgi:DnaJ family protein A protein 5
MSQPQQKMRCHYDIFELQRTATTEEIKKQYKKLALRYHPDRNHGKENEAAEMFKLVSAAYTVLSDPQERKWYDDHREAILRGHHHGTDGNDDDDEDDVNVMNLWPYFNATCFSDFNESSAKNYFSVYSQVFSDLESYERKYFDDINVEAIPPFGDRSANHIDVIRFYNYWTNFASRMTFAWHDKYNPNDAPDRAVRRLIEKENKVLRDAARKEYNELVRGLANHVKKRDPRMEEILAAAREKKEAEELKRLNAKKDEKERKRQIRELNRQRDAEAEAQLEEEGEDKDAPRAFRLADNDEDDIDKYSNNYGGEDGQRIVGNTEDEDGVVIEMEESLGCEICDKYFKSIGQLSQHFNSKLHKTNEKMLLKKANEKAGTSSAKKNGKNSKKSPAPEPEEDDEDEEDDDAMEGPISVTEDAATETETVTVSEPASEATSAFAADADDEEFGCEICNKRFKSAAQLNQHLSSKVHKAKEKELQKLQKKGSGKQTSSKQANPASVTKDLDKLNLL